MARIIVASYVLRMPVGGYQSWMLQRWPDDIRQSRGEIAVCKNDFVSAGRRQR